MANTLKLKRSAVPSKVPTTGDLDLGELALNTYDGKLYTKKDNGTASIIEIGAGSGTVTSVAVSGGTTGLTVTGSPITTSGTITLGGTLGVANGGTGATTLTSGYLVKGNGTSAVSASRVYDTGTQVIVGGTSAPYGSLVVFPVSGSDTRIGIGGDDSGSGGTNTSGYVEIQNYNNDGFGQGFSITTSRGTRTSPTVLQVGDFVGGLGFYGRASSSSWPGVQIEAEVDGTPGANSLPTACIISTNAVERMRITGTGNVLIGNTNGTSKLTVTGTIESTTGGVKFPDGTTQTSAPTGAVVGTTDTQTLTNKRINPRVSSAASISSPLAWNSDNFDQYAATAQAVALTINADAGTPVDGQKAIFRFIDNATPRVLTFTGGVSKGFQPVGVTMTVSGSNWTYTTTASKLTYFGCIYNAGDSRWDIIAISQEA